MHFWCAILHQMDDSAAALAASIGTRVRSERQSRGWTLDQLAQAAAVSRRMVVSVEQGEVNPSVGTLLRLSDALGVGLPALVQPPEPEPVTVTRRGRGAALWTGSAGGQGILLAGTAPPDVVELWDWTLAAGEEHTSEAHAVGTRELLHVLQGTVEIETAGQTIRLQTGDAAAFAGDSGHRYANPGRRTARFSLAVFEPGVGRPSRRGRR